MKTTLNGVAEDQAETKKLITEGTIIGGVIAAGIVFLGYITAK
jgi:hypothetical protein